MSYLDERILTTPNLRIFSFSELRKATKNFRVDVGEGRFGAVYRGMLHKNVALNNGSGLNIVVKKLDNERIHIFEDWQSEVRFLGRLSHSNLVKVLGYCWEDDELLVVYEFMPRGSLETHLFGCGSAVEPLPWDIRLKILIGAARGLAFLQTLKRLDICRGFMASNILLDGLFNSKISDFSYAELDSQKCSVLDEYNYERYLASDDQLRVKNDDVYCFGVVLVEMLTGSRASRRIWTSGSVGLVESYLADRRKLTIIMDSRLKGKYPPEAALGIAHLALNCLGAYSKTRPSMKEVLKTLERINASNENPWEPQINSAGHTT
ncbi:probable serine/threonine-protein kinase PIX13 [Rhododendron vialii]|uniref:probable serine/threonine-protein kinase PIX13 n=1 Tax=Rhododendron vialii TaxID=182163 RepID=UPI00265FAA91|nr:probable serine/threonine-protein kinase PIX13 [Rhododendron vialii]